MYVDKLDDIVNTYNITYHRTIKMKPVHINLSTYIGVESNEKDPKCKFGDHWRISKYRNIFAKGYTPNWSEDSFVIKKFKKIVQRVCNWRLLFIYYAK